MWWANPGWWGSPPQAALAGGGAAPAAQSIVLTAASNQLLQRTPSLATTDGKKVTIAFWFKYLSAISSKYFYSGGSNAGYNFSMRFDSGQYGALDSLGVIYEVKDPGGNVADTTTWHHLCFAFDTTQAVAANRAHVYLEGVDVTSSSSTFPALNLDLHSTINAVQANIGDVTWNAGANTMDVKLAYFYLIDGQTLTPSSFTTGTGVGSIHPQAYGGTFGNNGFFLNGTNSGGTVQDQSGRGNDWTAVNGVTYSADIPT